MDFASSSAGVQRRSVVRRHPVVVAAVLALVALAIGLPTLARLGAERAFTGLLGTPVQMVAVWWNPFTGLASARGVSIGNGEERIAVRGVSAVVDALALWGGDVAVARLVLDGPDAAVSIDEQHRVTITGLGSTASAGAPPRVVIHEVEISDGRLLVRHPSGGAVRASTLHISHLHANDIDLESTPSGVRLTASGRLDGSIDGAPLEGDMQLALASDALKIAGTLTVSGMSVTRDVLPLPPELADFTATVDARARVDLTGQPLGGTLQLGLTLADARLAAAGGTEVSAKKASLPEVRVDLSARSLDLGAVTVDAPAVLAAIGAEQLEVPVRSAAGAGEQAWALRSGVMQARGGRIEVRRDDAALALTFDSARWDGMRPGRRSAFAATLRAESGGVISLDGTLGVDPLQAEIDVRLDDLSLPPLAPLAREVPLRLSKGTADGALHVAYARGRHSAAGQLQAHDVHTAPPDAAQPSEVMAVHAADVRFSAIAAEPAPVIDVSLLKLDYPYVMVQRQASGVFPYSLIAGGEATPVLAGAPPANAPPRLSIQRLEIEGGKIELVDATQEPPYWTSLTDVSAVAEEILPAEGTVARFEATGKQDELSPVQISGTLTADGPVVRLALQDVLLESMNTYMSPMLGYDFTAGRVSVTATAAPAPPLIESTVEVILRGVDLLQTGHDAVQQQSGVPLPIALGLIANRSGEIRLTLPFFVDLKARSVELGSVIWQGVRRAIVGALASPLRLLGSLFGTGGAPHAFAIDPIPFRSGSAALDDAGKARVADIGRILQAHRSLVLVLMPQITNDDVREVGPERAVALAAERNAAVRDAFVDGADLAADRILLVEWKPSTRAEATGRPGVYVELQDAG